MAREILFKAKRIDNSKWIEGYYFYNPNIDKHFVHNWLSGGLVEVNKDTICQYTGLTDKNGNKIWEKDIVRYTDDIINKVKEDLIKWNETHASFVRVHKSKMGLQYLFINKSIANECEVIGNKFDNPELIENNDLAR